MASHVSQRAEVSPAPSALGSRLELLELLLGCDDPRECAQAAVAWLGACGARQVLIAVHELGVLHGVAGRGVLPAEVARFAWQPEARELRLLQGGTWILSTAQLPGSTFPRGRRLLCAAIPAVDDGEAVAGVLLVGPVGPRTAHLATWLCGALSKKIAALRSTRALHDTTRRLSRENALLHRVIDASPDPSLFTDTDGRLIVANSRAESLFAASDDESDGRRRAVALNNMLFSAAIAQRTIADGGPIRRELMLVDPSDGSDLLFELLSTHIYTPGEGTGVVSILRNVNDLRHATEELEANYRRLRQAEARVRAERDRLNLIIDSVADPILVTDPAGNIIRMNAPAERMFTVTQPAGTDAERAVRANDAHLSSFVSNVYLSTGAVCWRGEITFFDPVTGAAVPVEAVAGKILSETGELTAVATILHDRTEALEKARYYDQLTQAKGELEERVREATSELVRQNELLQRQRLELEQASNLKSQFLANMSHEFRTPLNGILGYTSMLLQGVHGKLGPEPHRSLTRVDANAKHLLSIIEGILDIARIEAGKMPLHLSDFRLPDMIYGVIAQLEPLIARAPAEVKVTIGDPLTLVRSDVQKVKQIVLNLVTNALRFTPAGEIRVAADYSAATDEVTITVADTGIGIAREDHERVFEDFSQADNSPTREYGGTGLGLAICRRLAKMIEGKVTLESELGQGSTFRVSFPGRPTRRRA